MTHLDALELRLSNERMRLATEKSPKARELRRVWVAGIEKEIAAEREFIGESVPTDDELLAELAQ
jgi:hypothetical protein